MNSIIDSEVVGGIMLLVKLNIINYRNYYVNDTY